MPLVSVIVPNYNHAPFLEERIVTILNQTFTDFEIILMDDCSTDQSASILKKYEGHGKVSHVVINSTNSGSPFKQWEKGISISKGDFIWIAESDDWCEPNLLDVLVTGLSGKRDCVVAYAQSYKVNLDGEITWQSRHDKLSEYIDGPKFVREYMLKSNAIFNASMALFKREAFTAISNKYTNFKFCGDWLFWMEIANQGEVFVSGKLLNYFRKHDKDVSGKAYASGNNFLEELQVLEIIREKMNIEELYYTRALNKRYIQYCDVRSAISMDMRKLIDDAFFKGINRPYAFFLKSNSVKLTLKRFIKSLFKSIF